jgi:dihydrofolate reductase
MKKIIVAAKSENNVIGKSGGLPWDMPADRAFFLDIIADGWLLTGRTSYESNQGNSLFHEERDFIIVTRREDYEAPGAIVVHSLEAGFAAAEAAGAEQLYVLGGGKIYAQAMDSVDRLIITEIHTELEGDVFFPKIDFDKWREVSREDRARDAENPYDYSFVVYERR